MLLILCRYWLSALDKVMHIDEDVDKSQGWFSNQLVSILELGRIQRFIEKLSDECQVA